MFFLLIIYTHITCNSTITSATRHEHGNSRPDIVVRKVSPVDNYIVRSYRVVIVAINIVTRRTNKVQIIVIHKHNI